MQMATRRLPSLDNTQSFRAQAGPSRQALFVIFGLALLGRLMALLSTVTSHPHNWLFSHPWEMGFLANTLLHGQGYSSPFGIPTGPTAFIAPGYPTLIAGIFLIFGIDTFASALFIMGMQIVVSLVTIWLIMYVARTMLDSRSTTLAGAFWAVSPPLLFVPAIFWESSFSECAVIGVIALALRYSRDSTTRHWLILGVLCGIIVLTNPALLFTLLAIMGWLAFQTRSVSRTAPLLGVLALAVVFAPWPIRNAIRFHAFIPLRSTVGFEMWMGNRPGATGRLDESIFPMFNQHELASYVAMGEVPYVQSKSQLASEYIRSHPGIFLKMTARRAYRFWAGTGNVNASPVYEIHALLTTIFGFAGLVLIYRRRSRPFAILMALPLILFPVPYYITHAEFRYRLNIDPVMTVLAAFAITQMAAAWSKRRHTTTTSDLIETKHA
jgi:hypothetical protein